MKTKLIKFFNLIKKDKQARILFVMTIAMLFIFTIGYSLSVFTNSSNKKVANIKVNDLSFNITTNSGESDDRILHLQAGKTESFDVVLTNLNKVDVKYELRYELCNNQDCTSTSNEIPNDLQVYKENDNTNINGSLKPNKINTIKIMSKNKSSNDYYIKLNLNAGYIWNELELANQIKSLSINIDTINILSFVDGKEVSYIPTSCSYKVTMQAYNNGTEVSSDSLELICNYYSNKWSISFKELDILPDTIKLNFTSLDVPSSALIKEFDYIAPTTSYSEPYYTYSAPATGTYKLETWGAQGGSAKSYIGGYGGYSVGNIHLIKDEVIYIYVGGTGGSNCHAPSDKIPTYCSSGYNGGGKGVSSDYYGYVSGGGGATHISTKIGLLSTFEKNIESILIVSGGGGGATYYSYNGSTHIGYPGSGGGFIGNTGYNNSSIEPKSSGGTQKNGFKFGLGYSHTYVSDTYTTQPGGGSGLYGGNGSGNSGGGGGSGYIGNSLLINKYMYCYGCEQSTEETTYTLNTLGTSNLLDKTNCPNGYSSSPISKCAKAGNGYAKITFVNDAN